MTSPEVYSTLRILSEVGVLGGLVAAPFLLYNFVFVYIPERRLERKSGGVLKAKYPIKSVAAFLLAVGVGITSASIGNYLGQRDTVAFLSRSNQQYTVVVNGSAIDRGDDLVTDLNRMCTWFCAHHSHPTDLFHVEIEDSEKNMLRLDFHRDSDIQTEYWVYNDDGGDELGRLTTTTLDNIPPVRTHR